MALLALVASPASVLAGEPKVCGAPIALNDGWTLAAQAEVGLDAARLCELDSFVAQWPDANIHAVVVVRNGKLAMERYFSGEDERWGDKLGRVTYGPEGKHDLRSISKSVTSLLVGIALSEGKFPALDSPVFDAFPDYADLRTPEKARITFRHLLTMSAGLTWDENRPWSDPRNNEAGMILAADPFRYILSQPVAHPAGTVYAYSGGGTSLLGETLVRSTGRSLRDYARDKLFDQWWLGRSFRNGGELVWAAGVGLGGQRLYVVPALDLVVMINAGHYSGPLQGVIPAGIFNRVVLPAVKD